MSDAAVTAFVIAAFALLPAGLFAVYWRQRLGFTGGPEPVVPCAVRWWKGPLGLGWRQGFVKLSENELYWRRRLSFRSGADLAVARSSLSLRDRDRVDWQGWLWIAGADVLRLATSGAGLELGLHPDDADLLLDWLGTPADRPSPRLSRKLNVGLWLLYLAGSTVLIALATGRLWLFPIVAAAAAVGGGAWAIGAVLVRRRQLRSLASEDDFISTAGEVFAFLDDFGFGDAYAQLLPWRTVVAFTGTGDRVVAITNDRRVETLELELGRRSDGDLRRLRDVVAAAGHPDPDRLTRYRGEDGPLRKALEANAHALRVWGRDFIVDRT